MLLFYQLTRQMSCKTHFSILKLVKPLVFRQGEGAVSSVTLPEVGEIFEAGSPAIVSGWGTNY